MRLLYAFVSWCIVALGATHMLATLRIFNSLTSSALWFFNGGITLVLTGVLNLLNRIYGHAAPGLRRVCFAANILLTAFSAVSGVVTGGTIPALIVVLGLMGGMTALSLSRRALIGPKPHAL